MTSFLIFKIILFMETVPLLMMAITQIIVTVLTGYFFWKVLKTPPKPEPDSYSENDEEKK